MNHVLSVTNCTSCTSIRYVIKCTYAWKTLILVQKGFCVIFHAHTALFHFEPLLKSYMEHRKSAQIEISIFIIKQTSVTVPSGLSIIHSIIHSDPGVAYGGWKLNIYKLKEYLISCDLTVKYLICKCLRCIF